jgi:hypothetical protein
VGEKGVEGEYQLSLFGGRIRKGREKRKCKKDKEGR